MINPFKSLGDLKQVRNQAIKIQQALAAEKITVEKNGVKVEMSGDQRILSLTINGQPAFDVQEAIGEAIKKSQEVAAQKMQSLSGGLGGLLG